MEEEDDYQIGIVPEEPINKYQRNSFAVSLIPLIILIAFVFSEFVLLQKKRKYKPKNRCST
ncbi:MAG: hypothetical protein V3U20_00595, partial [Thermoplasmata archaeon]